ncbi:MAG: serine/threonine protein kinase, partial [Deltaproteobacteria bacterium]|nr:serine/threonine protein kinase [Deltaproteobacteria bacterium]
MKQCSLCRRIFVDTQEACPMDGGRLVAAPPDIETPPNLGRELGPYRLIALLGTGGMGNIYIGAHTRLNRQVAIKLLRPELRNRPEAITRFFEEATTVNRARHPNIVESIDLVDDVVDGAYCVLELLRGTDLDTHLQRGRLSIASAIHIGTQIADALGVVHALDIVHRDLKPQNLILIERDGRDDFVKLIDFGVAQMSDDTTSGIPFGTAAYMAPEQAAGERVDGRADVYALGVVLFEMVAGRHPFPAASDHEYLLRHADDPPPRPSKVTPAARIPRQLESIIMRCLEKRPEHRFANAAEVATALRLVDPQQPARRWPWAVAAVVVASAATAVVAVPKIFQGGTAVAADPQPAAVVAAGAPAPAPATEQQLMTLGFESDPPGARVFREGETVPLGTTPFEVTVKHSDRAGRVRFELAGYQPLLVKMHN